MHELREMKNVRKVEIEFNDSERSVCKTCYENLCQSCPNIKEMKLWQFVFEQAEFNKWPRLERLETKYSMVILYTFKVLTPVEVLDGSYISDNFQNAQLSNSCQKF